jgi:hypothetical protein
MTTTLEQDGRGHNLTWVGTNDAPGTGVEPIPITLAIEVGNYNVDKGVPPTFSNPLGPAQLPLLRAAEATWEVLANIRFIDVPDVFNAPGTMPDIRVGLADLRSSLFPPKTLGFTHYRYDANGKFENDNRVAVQDPVTFRVTKLDDGDFQYNGTGVTMFQEFVSQLGHALGLGPNTSDPTSIMNPVLTSNNRAPDSQDVAAIQSLYGTSHISGENIPADVLSTLRALAGQ